MIEVRHNEHGFEIRNSDDSNSRLITGYALVFNSWSVDLGGFREIIQPEAIEGVIERSDILALLDHDQSRGVLARSTNGKGSLKLTVDEKGLRYEFEAPKTPLGDEVLESIRRGDLRSSSFGFTVDEDEWEETETGVVRTIRRFDKLFDVSAVYHPAYEETSVDTRGLKSLLEKKQQNIDDMSEKEKDIVTRMKSLLEEYESLESKVEESEEKRECNKEEDKREEDPEKDNEEKTERSEEEPEKETEEERSEETEEEDKKEESSEEEKEEKKDDEERNSETDLSTIEYRKTNTENNHINMNQNFSLLKGIRSLVEGRNFDEATQKIHDAGVAEFRKSNLTIKGNSLALPLAGIQNETRGAILAGTATQGAEIVETQKLNLVVALREKMILAQAGATMLNGLVGNVEIPYYSGSTASWKSEGAKADRGEGTFKTKTLSPKRLTACIHVSRQFLLQDAIGAEEALKRDLVDALAVEWEKTILGDGAGNAYTPAGLFNGVTPDTNPVEWSDIVELEAELDHQNISGSKVYLLSPAAKAILRTTKIDAGSGRLVLEGNGEINGIPTYCSQAVTDKGLILCDPKEIYLATWSGINLHIDENTLCDEDTIRIVANMYVDTVTRRDEAIVKKILA